MTSPLATSEFRALLDVAVDAVIIIDHRGIIEAFNRAAEKLFGYQSAEVLGVNISRLMPEPHRSQHGGHLERYLRTGVANIIGIGREVEACRKDGSIFPVSLAVGRIPESDPPRFVGFLHDLTARRQAAEEQQRMQQRMARVSHLVTMGEMAAAIAHEINQPLAAINNYAQACERLLHLPKPELAEVQDAMRQISGQALRAAEIIRRVRHMVRMQEPRREPTDINRLIEELSGLAGSDARQHGVQLSLELADDLPSVEVDSIQIQQVLVNLIHNAVEALAAAGAGERKIVVSTRRHAPGEIEVSVADSGPGVEPAIVERMFDPFCTTKEQGTGLGLAISKTIVGSHRGRIDYHPNAPRGACFVVTLPLGRASPR
jgi:two-component system, LuxR family, sensor kinase FixL